MARVHKLLLGLASSSVLYSGLVPALGLGSISLHSALNQPLEADIQLLEVGDLSADEVRVRLASDADFQRSGVERIFFLNDLRFTPLFKGTHSIIRVTSSKPIREPYLNFVVELTRPNGQLLREYTVLLDPPGSSAYRAVAQVPAYAAPRATQQLPPKRAKPLPVATLGNRYRVVAGDSLWLIAQRLHTNAGQPSAPALMTAIQALNPQAFAGGDSSRLKLGADLLLPDSIAAVTATNLPAAPSTEPATARADNSANASPLPVDPVPSTSRISAAAALAQVEERVARELAARAEENRQLQASMLVLQAQLGALQEQMQGKDQQLELLRAELAASRIATLPASPARPLTGPGKPDAAPLTATQPAADGSNSSLLAWLLGGSSLLLGLLSALLWRARGRQTAVAAASAAVPQPPVRAAIESAAEWPTLESEPAHTAEHEPQPPSEAVAPLPPLPPLPLRPAATADPLEGANMYIAYGRFSEALGILRKGVEAQPQRTELRLRMLEVLGELGDSAGFAREEAVLRQQGVAPALLDQLWVRFAHGLVSEPEITLDDAVSALDKGGLAEKAASPQLLDDFQLNLEDLSLDASWDLLSPFKPAATARSKAVANDAAFRSDLQQLPEVSEVPLTQEALSPFANWSADSGVQDDILEEEFADAFAGESFKSINKPALTDLELLATNRENLVKLNKALAYIAQGNLGSACSILNEVICDGDAQQQQEARELLAKIA